MNLLLQRKTPNGWQKLCGGGREVKDASALSLWEAVLPGTVAQDRVKEPELDAQ